MFTIKSLKLFVLVVVLALPLTACGQRAALKTADDAIQDSTSY